MSLAYRSDIDGLRALAVMFVVFNHVGIGMFSGGYIGVDIFFVISGYLITSIVFKDIQQERYSIANFYKKRIVRLAPALFLMLVVVSIIASFILLPNELEDYSWSLLYSTFFMANIYMSKEVGDYFSPSVDETPLLHLWSLGVEEQFYLFWPLILVFLCHRKYTAYLKWWVLAFICASLIYAENAIFKNAAKAYYPMPVRAFELFIGALIVFIPQIKMPIWCSKNLIWLAVIGLGISAVTLGKNTHFPGAMALIPCLITAVIIYIGQGFQNSNIVLSNPVSIWLGKISYPLYLWHWPVIVLFHILMVEFTALHQGVMIAISIVLAALTYYFIEQPSRRFLKFSNQRVILFGFFVPAIVLSVFVSIVIEQHGFPQRFSAQVNQQIKAMDTYAHQVRWACHNGMGPTDLPRRKDCLLGIKKDKVDVLLIGDSHANYTAGMLDIWLKDAQLRGYDITQDTTIFLPEVDLYHKQKNRFFLYPEFKQRNDTLREHLKYHHYSTVVLAGYYANYISNPHYLLKGQNGQSAALAYEQGLRNAINILQKSSDHIVFIMDLPELHHLPANCIVRQKTLNLNQLCQLKQDQVQNDARPFMTIFKRVLQDYPNIQVIDPKHVICNETVCETAINDIPLYRTQDNDHLNLIGAEEVGKEYLRKFGNPFKP